MARRTARPMQSNNNWIWSVVHENKSYAKFQLNISKHVEEKCGKLHTSYILSSQKGITPSKIGAKWRQSNFICSTSKQSHVQNFQLNVSKHVREKFGKLHISYIKSSQEA